MTFFTRPTTQNILELLDFIGFNYQVGQRIKIGIFIGTYLVVVVHKGLEGEDHSQVLLLVPHHHGMAGQHKSRGGTKYEC